MQTNLTLQHILPYVSGLKMINCKTGRRITVIGIKNDKESVIVVDDNYENWHLKWYDFKPILKPLSDYQSGMICEELNLPIDVALLASGHKTVEQCSYAAIKSMAAAKIDMFNLIPDGLAVDENTLTEKVY